MAASSTTSIPSDEPPKRGLTTKGGAKGKEAVPGFTATRGRVGSPAWAARAVKASLSIPR